jgi:3-methyladenine DNA glycosylase AlkD
MNSDNPNFQTYGHTIQEIEKIVKSFFVDCECSYNQAAIIFRNLVTSDVLEYQFAGIFFLNHFKREFSEQTVDLFQEAFSKYCSTWAFCDSSCIRVVGPFLAKRDQLAKTTIESWADSERLWVRRASLVILLKIIMLKKDFEPSYVFNFIERMLKYPEEYIQKGIGWLLKTCSRYKPDVVFKYLEKNKKDLPRLILRYASEKYSKENRARILRNE